VIGIVFETNLVSVICFNSSYFYSVSFEFTSPEFIESLEIISYLSGGFSTTPNVELEVYVSNSKGLSSCPGTGWTLGGTFALCDVSDFKVTKFDLMQNAFSLCLASTKANCAATVNELIAFREINFYYDCISVAVSPIATSSSISAKETIVSTVTISPTSTSTTPQICNMNPDVVLDTTATSGRINSSLAMDGDVNTYWNATFFVNQTYVYSKVNTLHIS